MMLRAPWDEEQGAPFPSLGGSAPRRDPNLDPDPVPPLCPSPWVGWHWDAGLCALGVPYAPRHSLGASPHSLPQFPSPPPHRPQPSVLML